MNNQILYDKIISVTLYRPPYTETAKYTTHIVTGYGETVIDKQRVLYNYSGTTYEPKQLGGRTPVSTGIEFYEGRVYKVFMGYKQGKNGYENAVYKTVRASGNVYFLDTLEQMKTGRAANGTIFKTGDRIRVKEDNSIWTAVVKEGFSGFESTAITTREELIEEPAETLVLNCTNEGLKPDMAFTINLLPGQNCYGAVLKVRNLNLENKNIRLWTRMVVTAGYRTGITATYTCPIFASYIEEPNPDGITVFEGITVGVAEGILNNRYTEIVFVQERMKLIDLVKGVAPGVADGITVECAIDDSIMNQEITISKQTVYAQNGAAVLNWLQTTISQFIQTISENNGERVSAFVQLVDNRLQIIAINGPNKKPEAVENIISLDMVSGATFNGTALTVIAPWNPALQPGNLFYMPPEFINGSKLPNVLATEDYRNEDNLYRAITISVSFASVENTNRMEVLAIPAQWAGQLPSNRTTSMTADMLAAVLRNDIDENPNHVQVGEVSSKNAKDVNNVKPVADTDKHIFADNENIITAWGVWTSIEIDISNGNCLSKILEYYFLKYSNGPKLLKGEKGIQNEYAYFQEKSYFENPRNQQALDHFQNTGCWANTLWWPLTMVGTYWRKKKDDANNMSNNWDRIDPKNPNLIHEGYSLYIPIWSDSWDSQLNKMKTIKDIWKWAYIEYGDLYPDMRKTWRAMYYYLGGQDDIG